jgi:DMSO/TMAO reductase YedYZ molybdopterin-dependent catalytic subunit
MRIKTVFFYLWLAIAGTVHAQAPTPAGSAEAPLVVRVNSSERAFTLDDLKKLPSHTVKGRIHDAPEHSYTGVSLGDVLRQAGMGSGLHGSGQANAVVVEAPDGYRIVFAPAELDPLYTDRVIVIAWSRDGGPLPENEQPLRLIVPGEKHPARWMRQVRRVSVVPVPQGTP